MGTFFGFGIGHSINGTWNKTGWIFTLTQSISAALIPIGVISAFLGTDTDGTILSIGAYGYIASRVGEIIDVWVRPKVYDVTELVPVSNPTQNYRQPRARLSPWVSPNSAGLVARLSF